MNLKIKFKLTKYKIKIIFILFYILVGRYVNLQSSETKAVIKINGQDWSKDEDGFNLVVLDFLTGEVEATESFDTAVDGGASRAMTSFIISLAPGKIILAATRGNAGELMGNTAYTALVISVINLSVFSVRVCEWVCVCLFIQATNFILYFRKLDILIK